MCSPLANFLPIVNYMCKWTNDQYKFFFSLSTFSVGLVVQLLISHWDPYDIVGVPKVNVTFVGILKSSTNLEINCT